MSANGRAPLKGARARSRVSQEGSPEGDLLREIYSGKIEEIFYTHKHLIKLIFFDQSYNY